MVAKRLRKQMLCWTCDGCFYNSMSQKSHMGVHGCVTFMSDRLSWLDDCAAYNESVKALQATGDYKSADFDEWKEWAIEAAHNIICHTEDYGASEPEVPETIRAEITTEIVAQAVSILKSIHAAFCGVESFGEALELVSQDCYIHFEEVLAKMGLEAMPFSQKEDLYTCVHRDLLGDAPMTPYYG